MAYRILIVDDEPILTELLSSHLQDHGYTVSVANSSVIKEHIRKTRAKLMQASGSEYIETVWGMGYRWKK